MIEYQRDPFADMVRNNRPRIRQIKLKDGYNAKDLLWHGLTAYEGDNAQWLSEYDEIADWLTDNKHKGLMLAGNCGMGKTLIAMHILPVILKEYCEDDCSIFCGNKLSDIDVYSAYQMNEAYRDEKKRSTLFYKHPIMIDDFGTESEINIFGERHMVFSEIVDDAEKNGRLLILTTNLTSKKIEAQYDVRIRDRLRGLVKKIGFEGKSLRK